MSWEYNGNEDQFWDYSDNLRRKDSFHPDDYENFSFANSPFLDCAVQYLQLNDNGIDWQQKELLMYRVKYYNSYIAQIENFLSKIKVPLNYKNELNELIDRYNVTKGKREFNANISQLKSKLNEILGIRYYNFQSSLDYFLHILRNLDERLKRSPVFFIVTQMTLNCINTDIFNRLSHGEKYIKPYERGYNHTNSKFLSYDECETIITEELDDVFLNSYTYAEEYDFFSNCAFRRNLLCRLNIAYKQYKREILPLLQGEGLEHNFTHRSFEFNLDGVVCLKDETLGVVFDSDPSNSQFYMKIQFCLNDEMKENECIIVLNKKFMPIGIKLWGGSLYKYQSVYQIHMNNWFNLERENYDLGSMSRINTIKYLKEILSNLKH